MIDSSKWAVLEAGLQVHAGQVGRQLDLPQGRRGEVPASRPGSIRRYGAAVVVMAFDEQGQADTIERKVDDLRARLPAPHRGGRLRARATSSSTRTSSPSPPASRSTTTTRVDFIEAVPPDQGSASRAPNVSGGISNVSFSFRGNNAVREAMHAAFLYHAIHAGLDMGIVNAGQLAVYEEIPQDLLELVEDVLLNRRPDATERLLDVRRDGEEGRRRARRRSDRRGAARRSRSGSRTRWSRASSTTSTRTSRRRGRSTERPLESSKGR